MARAPEDLLRECTVRVRAGDRSGAGFFVAPGKVLTCAHVVGDDDVSVVWERDGHDPVEIRVAGRMLLNDRGRPIEALTGYPDIAILDLDHADRACFGDHPCVALGTKWPSPADEFQAFGYPEQGGSVRLTPVKLAYRGQQGTDPTAYLDLASDKVEPGMSGGPVLNLSSGQVCGVVVASKDVAAPEGALAVPWSCVEADLKKVIDDNHEFHAHDRRWNEAAARAGVRTPWPPDRCPFPGLVAMEARDADVFFGRKDEVRDLVRRTNASLGKCDGDLLVMVGPSGAGKSSLLRAGLLAQLSRPETGWAVADPFEPGIRPLDQLVRGLVALAPQKITEADCKDRLARDGLAVVAEWLLDHTEPRSRRLLIPLDQAEQLTTVTKPGERDELLPVLNSGLGTGSRATVVMSVRTDHLDELQRLPLIGGMVSNLFVVHLIEASRLPAVIEGPAGRAGLTFEAGLAARLARDAARGSGETVDALPLLAFTLREMYDLSASDRRSTITEADYEQVGRIEGAIEKHAATAESLLPEGSGPVLGRLLPRFVVLSEDRAPTGRPITRNRLDPAETAIVGTLEDQRLLTGTDDENLNSTGRSVRLAHDKLITAWPTLAKAVEDHQEDLLLETRLERQAKDWDQGNGGLLDQATTARAAEWLDWPAQAEADNDAAGRYVRASRKALRNQRRRRAAVLSVLVVFTLVASVFAVAAFNYATVATQQRDVAVSDQLISQSENLGDTNPVLSKLESIAAWRLHPTSDARYAMLTAAARPGIAALTGHTGSVNSVAFSPDGKTLASGSSDGTVRLWDVATRQQIGTPLTSHTGGVLSVAFSPDGKTLASGSNDDTVQLWDVATRQQIGTPLTGNSDGGSGDGDSGDGVSSVAFSPDGKTLATGSVSTLRLWDVATHQHIGTPLSSLFSHNLGVSFVAFSPDGKTLASGGGGPVRLWDVATRQQIWTPLTSHTGIVWAVAFSPDGKTLATSGGDGTVQLWDVATHQHIGTPLTSNSDGDSSVTFSPDGKTLASGSGGTVQLWDVATHQQIGTPLTSSSDPDMAVGTVAFSPDGKTLASGGSDDTVRLWDVPSIVGIATLTCHTGGVNSVAFSPDGKTLATGGGDGTVRLWDLATHQQIGTPLAGNSDGDTGGGVSSVAFSPDGKTLATGGSDDTVRLWDVATHQQIGTPLAGNTGGVLSVAFSPDGKTLATGDGDGTVRLWDVATHQQIGTPLAGNSDGGVNDEVYSVAFSPDGKTLATGGGEDWTVQLWDVATHRQIGTPLAGNTVGVLSVAFSPDGKTLATGGGDDTVRLWDVATHQQIGTPLTGHTDLVYSVAFSPDGQTLASGSNDDTVRLWDVATHQQIGDPLTVHTDNVDSVAFSPDGQTLASGSGDDTLRLWDVAYVTDLVPHLCASAQRSLTRTEWAQYAPGPAYQNVCP